MNSKAAVILLVAICALLGVGLLMTHNQALKEREANEATIAAATKLAAALQAQLDAATAAITGQPIPTPTVATTQPDAATIPSQPTASIPASSAPSTNLQAALAKAAAEAEAAKVAVEKAQASAAAADTLLAAEKKKAVSELSAAAEKFASMEKTKDGTITTLGEQLEELSTEKAALDKTVANLNTEITGLNKDLIDLKVSIAKTEKELENTKGDKEFLITELQRMQREQEDIEKQMNDLEFVSEQLSKLKSERNVARRLDWIRRGIYNQRKKGATILVENTRRSSRPKAGERLSPSPLQVELHKDGTVSIKAGVTPEQMLEKK